MKRLIRLPTVMAGTGQKKSSIYAAIKAGTFPAQIPIGDRAVAWDESEVLAWIERRISEARKKSPCGE